MESILLINICIREFQRQAQSHRLELDSGNCGCEESRRELARLHEELAQREKHFKIPASDISMKWNNFRRAQEMRIDEFSMYWEKVTLLYRSSLHKFTNTGVGKNEMYE